MKLLDTSAWVEYFKGSKKGEVVRDCLKQPEVYTSALTLAELSRWFTVNKGDVGLAIEQVKKNSVIIQVEENALIESGKLYVTLRKTRKSIGMIDVILYVTALSHGLTLVTGDRDFHGLTSVEMI